MQPEPRKSRETPLSLWNTKKNENNYYENHEKRRQKSPMKVYPYKSDI